MSVSWRPGDQWDIGALCSREPRPSTGAHTRGQCHLEMQKASTRNGQGSQSPAEWTAAVKTSPSGPPGALRLGVPQLLLGPRPGSPHALLFSPLPQLACRFLGVSPPVSPAQITCCPMWWMMAWPREGSPRRVARAPYSPQPCTCDGGTFLLTCFSSAHSPHHGRHRGHRRPVHQVVLWRLLHVSCHRRAQARVGGRASWRRVGLLLSLRAQH